MINEEKFGRSSGHEDLAERDSTENGIEHVNNILDVVQEISSIVQNESARMEMISRVCDCLLEIRGYLNARIFTIDDDSISLPNLRSPESGSAEELIRDAQLPFLAIMAFRSESPVLINSSDEECSNFSESANCKSRSCISIRLETEERTYGVLHVSGFHEFTSDSKESQLLAWTASQVAHGLERIEREEQHKATKMGLLKSEGRLRSLFRENLAVMIILDPETRRFVDANDSALSFYGWDRETLLSKRIEDVNLNPLEELKKEMKRAYSSEKIKFNFQHRLADGSIKDVEVFSKKIELNGRDLMLSIVHDVTEQKRAERELQRTSDEMKKITLSVISALEATMNLRDPYTAGHQIRVTELATAIAERLSLEEDRKNALCFASMIHDVGKIKIPAEILNKPGQLNRLEFEMIKEHPLIGRNLFTKVDFKVPISEIVYQHHERLDGSGYPLGIKGDEILLEARILAVADVVEAMSSHRPYRHSLGTEAALEEINRNRDILYDSNVVSACTKVFEEGFEFPPEAASKNFGL